LIKDNIEQVITGQ